MECANHPGVEPAARCVTCGKCLCADCILDRGRYYCAACAPPETSPPSAPKAPAGRWLDKLEPGRAFSFPLDDPGWFATFLLGAMLLLVSFLVVPFFIVLGYQLEMVRAVAAGEENHLPPWDRIANKLKEGFFYFLVLAVYGLPFCLTLALTVVLGIAAGGWTLGFTRALAALLFLSGWLLTLVFGLLVRLALPEITGRFAMTGSMRQALKVREVARAVRADVRPFLVVLLVDLLVCAFIAPLGFIACCVGVAFTGFYAMLVNAHLYGQLARTCHVGDQSDD